jgi:hypothetical protein
MLVQGTLFGLDEPAPTARRRRRTRQDPAEVASRLKADAEHVEWRQAFGAFLATLPEPRRRELRRRVFGTVERGVA